MRRFAWLASLTVLPLMALAPQPGQAVPAVQHWSEIGDAGGPAHSQVMFGDGSVRTISGVIGGGDVIDVFGFLFAGAGRVFHAHVDVLNPPPEPESLFLHLLTEDGRRIAAGDGSVRVENLPT